MSQPAPVVLGIDDSLLSDFTLRWALDHARASGATLRLVCAYRWALIQPWERPFGELHLPELELLRAKADGLLIRAKERAVAIAPDLAVESEAIEGAPVPVLLGESGCASVLVLGSRWITAHGPVVLGSVAAAVTARSQCPVVVVRAPAEEPAAQAAVIVGVDGVEGSESVLAFGFDYANRHRLALTAVHCWKARHLSDDVKLHSPRSVERAESWLSEALAGWQQKFPYVTVHRVVISDDPVPALVAASVEQNLLVVGTRTRHAVTGALLGSVSQAVLHYAICPVAVVPSHTV